MTVDLEALRRSSGAVLCAECGKCTTTCPLSAVDGFSVSRMVAIRTADTDLPRFAFAVQRCLTCGACEIRCPQGVRFTEFARGLRVVIDEGQREPCPHGRAFQSTALLAAATPGARRDLDWLGDDLRVAENGEIGVFVGCAPLFDALFEQQFGTRTVEITRSAIRALNHLGIEPVLVDEEVCCGHDLLWGGDREGFEALARANVESFRERGISHILTTCAECARTWRLDYAEVASGYRPKVQHVAEFLAERIGGDELQFAGWEDGPVTFQDPCRLGRHLGVTEEPRRVLEAIPGVELVEMERSGVDADCCGTAGFIHCDAASRRLQSERLGSAVATGAGTLVTACPKCLIHFSCARSEDGRAGEEPPGIRVEDLTVLAARMLVGDPKDPEVQRQQTGAVP